MTPTPAMRSTIQSLNIPTHLQPHSPEWTQAVFTAAADAAAGLMDEAKALSDGEFLGRYLREYKPAIRRCRDVEKWALARMRQHGEQRAA